MVDFTKLKELINDNRLFIAVFICVIIVAVVGVSLIPQDQPEPPTDRPFIDGLGYDYTTATFEYTYIGPENPEESDKVVPKRVIVHTTDKITKETRLHEFNPTYKGEMQSYEVNLKELAEDPEDHLRTHPKINMTIVYTNGARETVASTIGPDNIADVLYTNYRIIQLDSGSVRVSFDEISAEQIEVKAPNKSYTVTEDGSQVTINPEDYYTDKNNDGMYETKGTVKINKQYKDISETIRTLNPSFDQPKAYTSESSIDGHFNLTISDMASYDSLTVKTPGGEYIKNYNLETHEYETGPNAYLQSADGVGQEQSNVLTIKEDAQVVEVYAEIDGQKYIVKKIGGQPNSDEN